MRFLKSGLLLTFAAVLTLPAAAQKSRPERATTDGRIRNGFVFGGVGAQIDGDRMSGYHKAGITGGLSSTIQASDRWNVRLEVTYMQKGARSPSQDSIPYQAPQPGQIPPLVQPTGQQQPGMYLRYRLNYIQLPVLVEFRATPQVTLYGGVSADYLLRATADYGYGYGPPLGAQFRRSDLMGHAGVDLGLGHRWSVTMRLMYSLRDISTGGLGTDRYLLWAGRLGGYRNNLLSTTLRFYLSDTPKFKGTPLFRFKRDDTDPAPAEPDNGTDSADEPTN